jgi:hypothetical protein
LGKNGKSVDVFYKMVVILRGEKISILSNRKVSNEILMGVTRGYPDTETAIGF